MARLHTSCTEEDLKATAIASLVLLALAATAACGAIVHVPGGASSIQAGIAAANDGDTVLVAPGTYVENISLMGKRVALLWLLYAAGMFR